MSETREQQIERLKGNDEGFYALPEEDKALLRKISVDMASHIVFRYSGRWDFRFSETFASDNIYRIHKDYQPEPDKPVFDGYELCEVYGLTKKTTSLCFNYKGSCYSLSAAPDIGCCGYVFNENPNMMSHTPIVYMQRGGEGLYGFHSAREFKEGVFPATLGWVVFKKGVE